MYARTPPINVVRVAHVHAIKIIYFYYIKQLNEYFVCFIERNGVVDEYSLDIQVVQGTFKAFKRFKEGSISVQFFK